MNNVKKNNIIFFLNLFFIIINCCIIFLACFQIRIDKSDCNTVKHLILNEMYSENYDYDLSNDLTIKDLVISNKISENQCCVIGVYIFDHRISSVFITKDKIEVYFRKIYKNSNYQNG